jgi:hypothetical protein
VAAGIITGIVIGADFSPGQRWCDSQINSADWPVSFHRLARGGYFHLTRQTEKSKLMGGRRFTYEAAPPHFSSAVTANVAWNCHDSCACKAGRA